METEPASASEHDGYLFDLGGAGGWQPSPPAAGAELLGYAVYEDGAAYPFFEESSFAAYLGKTVMRGCLFDHGVLWHSRTSDRHYPCAAAERARRAHQRRHGKACFVSAADWRQSISFSDAKAIAIDDAKLPVAVRRRMVGLATATARVSTGPPAPRARLALT